MATNYKLYYASRNGRVKDVRRLLNNKNVNISAMDNLKQTPLHIASINGHADVVKTLIKDPRIAVNQKDNDGQTPLFAASSICNIDVVKALLTAADVDVNTMDNDGLTPLIWTSYMGNLNIVKLLLAAPGIDVNVSNRHGETALIAASSANNTEVVKSLLAVPGIDVNMMDRNERTALDVAENKNIKNMLRNAMGIKIPWRNMNNVQRKNCKPLLIKGMLDKMKNNNNFIDMISHVKYNIKTLAPVNNTNNNLGSLGLIINARNEPVRFVNAIKLKSALNYKASMGQPRSLHGIFNANWSLINITKNEHNKIIKKFK